MIARLRVGAIGANCYLLPTGGLAEGGLASCIVVDPGAEPERIVELLDARNLVPALIACTHGHLDHVAAIAQLQAAFRTRGREVPVAIHRLDAAYLGPASEAKHRSLFAAIGALSFFEGLWSPLPAPDLLLEEGESLVDSAWHVIHSPGHSAGSICFYDKGRGLLVSGDTLFRDGVGRTDGPDSDPAALHESIALKLLSLPPATRVFPGHGEPTTIGREGGGRLAH